MNRSLMYMLSDVAGRCGISLRRASCILGIARSTHSRWRTREKARLPLVVPPGPRKMELEDMQALYLDIAALQHTTYRTKGTTALYERYSGTVSRRDFQALVQDQRLRLVAQRRDGYERVALGNSGVVWAMDDTMLQNRAGAGTGVWINHVRDIGAHYSFRPLCGALHWPLVVP